MLNQYPLWKNMLIFTIVVVCGLYALPNLYGEYPAVQVSMSKNNSDALLLAEEVKTELAKQQIQLLSFELENNQLLFKFTSTEEQIRAKELIADYLSSDYTVALNLTPATPEWLKALYAEPMKLGLDLRGGVNFLMEVDMSEAMMKQTQQLSNDIRATLREGKLRYTDFHVDEKRIDLHFSDKKTASDALALIRKSQVNIDYNKLSDTHFIIYFSENYIQEIRNYAVSQNITILRNRVNELGVAEPIVQRQGAERISVELPGIQDTARAKEILGTTATLEFRLVDERADLSRASRGVLPAGSELFYDKKDRPVVLKKQVILTGEHIVGAKFGFGETRQPEVNISLDSVGGRKMSNITKNNIGKPMATVFIQYKSTDKMKEDGSLIFEKVEEVISVATINSRLGQHFRITGVGSVEEANNLALLLRAGALVAPISIVQEKTIGPSLGQQNIDNGFAALQWGMLCVVLFMCFYYRAFGVVSVLALCINVVMMLGILSMIPGATLTMPGIAGIVLTIGMAVDGNVLIYERIREELKMGKPIQHAINEGYANAFSTIADANITTFITGIILFGVGSGPVKGFAVTLMIGIITSMFTSILCSRAIVNKIWGNKPLKHLSI